MTVGKGKTNVYVDVGFMYPAPPKNPGEKFRRSDPSDFESGTPRPFIPQHRFGTKEPSSSPGRGPGDIQNGKLNGITTNLEDRRK
jgi:hypothetical protein